MAFLAGDTCVIKAGDSHSQNQCPVSVLEADLGMLRLKEEMLAKRACVLKDLTDGHASIRKLLQASELQCY